MTVTTYSNNSLPLGAITLHRAGSALAAMYIRIQAWRDARRTARILDRLSTRQLDDIGLSRGDIETLFLNGRL